MVSVSDEALAIVKSALMDFKSDIEGISQKSGNKAESITLECRSQIQQTKIIISGIEERINYTENQIKYLCDEIAKDSSMLDSVDAHITLLYNRKHQVNFEIESLNSKIASLNSKLSGCENDEMRQQIQSQIEDKEGELYLAKRNLSALEAEISENENKKADLQNKIDKNKSMQMQYENELDILKNRNSKYKNKLERQKIAYNRIESDLNAYVDAIKKFESNSVETVQKDISAVDICITAIDGYMSVNL